MEEQTRAVHTPGPWKFQIGDSFSDTDYIVAQDDESKPEAERWVVLRWEKGPYRDKALEVANARLIAAAPDLLDACKAALQAFEANAMAEPGTAEWLYAATLSAKATELAMAAIQKAEGKP